MTHEDAYEDMDDMGSMQMHDELIAERTQEAMSHMPNEVGGANDPRFAA